MAGLSQQTGDCLVLQSRCAWKPRADAEPSGPAEKAEVMPTQPPVSGCGARFRMPGLENRQSEQVSLQKREKSQTG